MGSFVRAFTRRNLVAITAGVLLGGAPLLAFNFWLDGVIARQGQVEVATGARRAVALANSRLKLVIEALDGLAAQGVNSCSPGAIEAMRQSAFDAIPIKEVAVVECGTAFRYLKHMIGPQGFEVVAFVPVSLVGEQTGDVPGRARLAGRC